MHTPSNKHCNIRALSHKVKCSCSVQRIRTNLNNLTASKHATVEIGKPERHVFKALWQQATIEFTQWDHSIVACLHHIYMVLFFVHIPFMVNCAFRTTPVERLQQHPLLFKRTTLIARYFVWRLHPARSSHPGHRTILLQSESLSGMCAKLRTVAASNNRVHPTRSLYYCLFAPHNMVLFFMHIPFRCEPHIQRNASGEVATQPYVVRLSASFKKEVHIFLQ